MAISEQLPRGHLVAYAFQFWGHTKPLCALLAKTVRLRRTYATFFVALPFFDRVSNEISTQFLPQGEENLRELIRVVGLDSAPDPTDNTLVIGNLLEGYKSLLAGEPIRIKPNHDSVYKAIPPPQLVVLDFFGYHAMKGIKALSGSSVPIYAWQSAGASGMIITFGPERMGGNGDLAAKLENVKIEDRLALADISKLFQRDKGELIRIPGLPPMYDYEYIAQSLVMEGSHGPMVMNCHRFFSESDGIIHCTTPLYEAGALALFKEWYGERPVIAVGPLSPPINKATIEKEKAQSPVAIEVESFLNKVFDSHGANSVVYISFGTVFWMKDPEKIWAVLDVLIELNIPFLFSHASPFAVIPDDMKSKVDASGIGFMAKWLPQQMILQHPSCGWFVSHCGHNSTMESLTEGVPLICWPFGGDQATNAANVTVAHDAGYELFEVRSGPGLRPIHRLGDRTPEGTIEAVRREAIDVFTKAKGDDGQRKRANAQRLRSAIAESWADGGLCWKELQKVVDVLR